MTTVIVDYESGNLHSAEKSFQRMAREAGGGPVVVSGDPGGGRAGGADRAARRRGPSRTAGRG
jgi:glutamine amidotransferase